MSISLRFIAKNCWEQSLCVWTNELECAANISHTQGIHCSEREWLHTWFPSESLTVMVCWNRFFFFFCLRPHTKNKTEQITRDFPLTKRSILGINVISKRSIDAFSTTNTKQKDVGFFTSHICVKSTIKFTIELRIDSLMTSNQYHDVRLF